MKKAIAVLLLVFLTLSLCACGGSPGPKGKYTCLYEGVLPISLEFDGDKVTQRVGEGYVGEQVSYGTFTLDGNKVLCTYPSGNSDTYIYDEAKDSLSWEGSDTLVFTREK